MEAQRIELETKFAHLPDYTFEKLVSQALCVVGIPQNVVRNVAHYEKDNCLYKTQFSIDIASVQFDGNAKVSVTVNITGESAQKAKEILEPLMVNTIWGENWFTTTVNIFAERPQIMK